MKSISIEAVNDGELKIERVKFTETGESLIRIAIYSEQDTETELFLNRNSAEKFMAQMQSLLIGL